MHCLPIAKRSISQTTKHRSEFVIATSIIASINSTTKAHWQTICLLVPVKSKAPTATSSKNESSDRARGGNQKTQTTSSPCAWHLPTILGIATGTTKHVLENCYYFQMHPIAYAANCMLAYYVELTRLTARYTLITEFSESINVNHA